MENEIFKAGVRPGGPASLDEIKMLLCYILARLKAPMRFSQLHEVLDEKGLVNYFELVQAVEGLKKTGHIRAGEQEGAELYSVTGLGEEAAEVFEKTIPLTVREQAVQAAELLLRRQRRLAELTAEIQPSGEGYRGVFAIPDQGGPLLSFSLYAATREECEQMRRRFLNDPVFIYKCVAALLTGDGAMLDNLLPQQEKLF